MKTARRIANVFRVVGVLSIAIVAGLFLYSYRMLGLAEARTVKPAATSTSPATTRGVDVRETERGQPATRNYLE